MAKSPQHPTWEERRAMGKALRTVVPRAAHGAWKPSTGRRDVLRQLAASNRRRQPELIPLRLERMAASPHGFLRGAAAIMAADLAGTPVTGLDVLMSGDAHLTNFGLYGTPDGDVIFDVDDFDESTRGPWEWDLKRLTASINVAGREHGLSRKERRGAVEHAVSAYRQTAGRLQSLRTLEAWYESTSLERPGPLLTPFREAGPVISDIVHRAVIEARGRTSLAMFAKVAIPSGGGWSFREDPPTLTRLTRSLKTRVRQSLARYAMTLSAERRALLDHYQVEDVAHRVVGIGSVGLRTYLVLLIGNGPGDPLLLQIKEAVSPCAAPYLPFQRRYPSRHQGERVVLAHRALQASSDLLLGWTSVAGRSCFVRQMRNMKGSIPLAWLEGPTFLTYGAACATLLARAHARVGDIAAIAGYSGNSAALDEALADWAERYGDQTEADHATLVSAMKRGFGKVRSKK
jgi:uncharacterized protein (DUF2252 family)